MEFARDGDSSAALSAAGGRGLRGLSLGTEDAAGRKSLSGAADVTLPDDFGGAFGHQHASLSTTAPLSIASTRPPHPPPHPRAR